MNAPIRRIPIRMIMPWRCTAKPDWREFAKLMREGPNFPPVLVQRQSGSYPYRLFDGFHRTRAAKHVGRKTIAAIVIADLR
jgi:uncharacterized ParB-like nuclease family protein